MNSVRTQAGFSLLELMIAIALVGIITVIAIPSYRTMVQDSNIDAAGAAMTVMLNHARSEAAKRNSSIYLCSTRDSVNPKCTGNGQWFGGGTPLGGGVLVFYNGSATSDNPPDLDSPWDCTNRARDCLIDTIRVGDSISPEVSIFVDSGNIIRLRGDGSADNRSNMYICDARRDPTKGKYIIIDLIGKPVIRDFEYLTNIEKASAAAVCS